MMNIRHVTKSGTKSGLVARATLIAAAVSLIACASGQTPYGPKTDKNTFGYEEQKIESNRFRVTFKGNSRTSREIVETYLLFRSAEITKQNGGDYFIVVKDDTEAKKNLRSTGFRGGLSYYGAGRPFPYYGRGFPFGRFTHDVDIREITRYSAIAYIQIFEGDKPDAPAAYSAEEVIANLGPEIQRVGLKITK